MPAGTRGANRSTVSTAPAPVVARASANLLLSRKARSLGPAWSIGATLVISYDKSTPSRGTAPVSDAISASVSDARLAAIISTPLHDQTRTGSPVDVRASYHLGRP